MRRVHVEEGEARRRAAVLQDTISIAVADLGFFAQGELGGGVGENFNVTPIGNPFLWKMLALFWARKCASSILRGG